VTAVRRRLKRRRRSISLWVTLALLAAALVLVMPATASHPEESLPGSNFEIDTNANLKLDDPAPSIDWVSVTESRATDRPTGASDDSYQGGTKEDSVCPGEVTGSIPNNKSDLKTFHVFREAGTPGFLNLAWSRVTDPSGTTLMDFEFNQSSTSCASGPNKLRTTGDLLIEYSIDQGGARADITGRTWNGSAWGAPQDLDQPSATCGGNPCAAGTINSSPILAADSDGIVSSGQLNARTFGEAQLDLRLIFQSNKCVSFGSAMLKSRSSDAFTSQLKDFIRPVSINLTNCGKVIIHKQTIPDEDPNTTDFGYTKSFSTDPATANTFTLKDDATQTFNNVLFGSGYTVVEDVIPSNYAFDHADCTASVGVTPSISSATVTFAIDADTDVLECTYFNELQEGALRILKNSAKGGAVANAGAVFSYDGSSVTDNGAGDEDSDVGEVCVSGLTPGDYDVTETSAPPGYGLPADPGPETVTVVVGTNCTDNPPTGSAVVTFTDPPLSDIQVNFRDGGSGETSATISCDNTTGTGSNAAATGWDTSRTVTGIEAPTTVTCTIVIDP
jgi:hypothetical protein